MGKLYVIGVGKRNYYDLMLRTINILNGVDLIYCDEKIFDSFNKQFNKERLLVINITKHQQGVIML